MIKVKKKLNTSLNSSKVLGPDELHPRILKAFVSELGPMFTNLFLQSIDTGEMSKEWSLANTCPLYKTAIDLWLKITDKFLSLVYHASYLNMLFAQILWHTWMNMNFCPTDNMHSGKNIAVKLS